MSNLRKHFFNVNKAIELTPEEFNKEWAFVDNIWIRFNGNTLLNGTEWRTYVNSQNLNNQMDAKLVSPLPGETSCDLQAISNRDAVAEEAIKEYKPPAIANAASNIYSGSRKYQIKARGFDDLASHWECQPRC
ncbi:6695_t:CDS:2 [Ambispora gerdemannii]|uniref:6695_t:CDS:1 n=1 Tax=Ambispora gerdemannii TaxID=144530 RepID=A0A9N9D0L8_9GLOM|nr:6695_t:CDS:2 [Ambispora gerdemannii]